MSRTQEATGAPLPPPPFVVLCKEGWQLLVHVQPGAKESACGEPHDGRLRVRLAAPAVEGRANKALLAFMAEILGLKRARLRLLSGETGRRKRLLIEAGAEPDWSALLPRN